MLSRAVWNEQKPGDTCGHEPSNWINGDRLFWSITKETIQEKDLNQPGRFQLVQVLTRKVKFSTNVLSEARSEKHDAPDSGDASFFVPTSCKRKSKPRAEKHNQIPSSAVALTPPRDHPRSLSALRVTALTSIFMPGLDSIPINSALRLN